MKTFVSEADTFKKTFLLLLVLAITLVFFFVIRGFLVTLLLAAISSAMVSPVFKKLTGLFRGRRKAAAAVTTVGVFFVIVIPLLGLAGMLVAQAVDVSQAVRPWVERQVNEPDELDRLLQRVPFMDVLEPYKDQIVEKLGEFASHAGGFLVAKMADTTKGTAVFFFLLSIMLYSMYFFLLDGKATLNKILYYMPLSSNEENRMVEKFVSVSRATLKGTLVIGIVQGTLAGLAFWIAGINGVLFWGTIMAVLSVIPGIGAAVVWIPGVGYLVATGHITAAVLLAIWCAGLVGTVDNVLRPWLVGKDTKMPDLLILLSTLGGLVLFGALGVVLGPIVAALFLTVWDIYGVTFKDMLPEVIEPTAKR